MVYDGSKSGLNAVLYALPTVDSFARWVGMGSWLQDNDFADMFLNFPLHPSLQKYCGIDLSELFPELCPNDSQVIVTAWVHNAMGLSPSSYCSIQSVLLAKIIIKGDRRDKENPFHWKQIEHNLPFSEDYKASLPRLKKIRSDGQHGCEVIIYVDDQRIVGPSEELTWQASSRMAKGLCWLGLQEAARKRRVGSQRPGAWAGAIVYSDKGRVTKSVTQERWEKLRNKI